MGTFGSLDINLSNSTKTVQTKNILMKIGSNDWSEGQTSKFNPGPSNLQMTKTPSFENNENNVQWRNMSENQPTQDRVFIERVENYLQNILANHNKICPFSGKCSLVF